MNGLNFSSEGTRWRLAVITRDLALDAFVPPLPGPGLLFTSEGGSTRFMALDAEALPSLDELKAKSNEELGSLVHLASSLPINGQA